VLYEFYYWIENGNSGRDIWPLDNGFLATLWRPSLTKISPPGVSINPFVVWWMFHHTRLFANRDYSLFLIYHDTKLVHRSVIFPGYFRFPFMVHDDLQIGDIWTHQEYRRKSLARFAVQNIFHIFAKPGRRIWYIADKDNIASIRVAEKSGFAKAGEGCRTKRYGLNLFGSYVINHCCLK